MATWYVRPDTSHSGTRNGTSYGNAWGGWSEIVWGVGGVVGGDKLLVCGQHAYSSNITVGNHGGSGAATICTISGNYAPDNGRITFTGSAFFSNGRAWTVVDGLTINGGSSHCIYATAAASNCAYRSNRLIGNAAGAILNFEGGTGSNHLNIEVSDNYFNGTANNGAIRFLVTGTSASSFTGLKIRGNTFKNVSTTRSVIHLRMEATVDAASVFEDFEIIDNKFFGFSGLAIEAHSGTGRIEVSQGIVVSGNRMDGGTSAVGIPGFGGCISLQGWTPGGTLGVSLIEKNFGSNVVGAAGMANVFYGSYVVRDNVGTDLTSPTIDACGVLFDVGCVNCEAYRNTFKRLVPGAAVSNIACAVMVLGSSSNIRIFENVCHDCKVGVHVGSAGTGQSGIVVERNVFTGVTDWGIDVKSDSDRSVIVRNNIFSAASGSAVPVRVSGAAWTNENGNRFFGFGSPSGHTIGPESSVVTGSHQTAYSNIYVNPVAVATL